MQRIVIVIVIVIALRAFVTCMFQQKRSHVRLICFSFELQSGEKHRDDSDNLSIFKSKTETNKF